VEQGRKDWIRRNRRVFGIINAMTGVGVVGGCAVWQV
jgi:hypothetical protein